MVKLKLDIPEEFYKEEVRCGYRVSHEMKKLWAVELDLLAEFIRVCNENGFKYYIWGGTLLGAVRHKGYIPWDNDIDVMMTREEYERFCSIAPDLFEEPYFFQTNLTDPGSMRGHAQLRNSDTTMMLTNEIGGRYGFNQGVFIDIFPLDRIPVDDNTRDAFYEEIRVLRSKTEDYSSEHGRTGDNPYFAEFENLVRKYKDSDNTRVGEIVVACIQKDVIGFSESVLSDTVELPFEMLKLTAFAGYDEALRSWYGDYMEYVRDSQVHGDIFVDTDTSYKEYLNADNMALCQKLYDFEVQMIWRGDKEWQLKEQWSQLAEIWKTLEQIEPVSNRVIQNLESENAQLRAKVEELNSELEIIKGYGIIRLWRKLIRLKRKLKK